MYEDLVREPAVTLHRVADFIEHDLNYVQIQRSAIGSVKIPLTSFKEDLKRGQFAPVGRWKDTNKFPPDQLVLLESLVGGYLQQLGYALSDNRSPNTNQSSAARRMRIIYRNYYDLKQWAKINTPLSRLMVDYSASLIDK
jgi:hypothetical protein